MRRCLAGVDSRCKRSGVWRLEQRTEVEARKRESTARGEDG